jgi:hypothetical protein
MTAPSRITAAAVVVLSLLATSAALLRVDELRNGLQAVESEIARLEQTRASVTASLARDGAPPAEEPASADGEFHTWAHLIAAIHSAAATSRLDRFAYRTAGVQDLGSPPARAMLAMLTGEGSYDAIVDLVRSLPDTDPPLALERIEITAHAPRPRFTASVCLPTRLPVEGPVLLALDSKDAGRGGPGHKERNP